MKDLFTGELSQRLIFASIGILFSFWYSSRSGKQFTFTRILFEMLQGFFMAWVVDVSVKEFTTLGRNFTLVLIIIGAFFGSRIVAFLSKEAFEAAKKSALSWISGLGKKKEVDYSESDNEDIEP